MRIAGLLGVWWMLCGIVAAQGIIEFDPLKSLEYDLDPEPEKEEEPAPAPAKKFTGFDDPPAAKKRFGPIDRTKRTGSLPLPGPAPGSGSPDVPYVLPFIGLWLIICLAINTARVAWERKATMMQNDPMTTPPMRDQTFLLDRKLTLEVSVSQIIDGCLLFWAFCLSHWIVSTIGLSVGWNGWLGGGRIPLLRYFFWLMAIIVPITPIVLRCRGYYESPQTKSCWRTLWQLGQALLIMSVIIGGCVVFYKWGYQARSVLMLLVVIGGGLLLLKAVLVRAYLKQRMPVENPA